MRIITHLMGGLGNQMFQYAAGRRIQVASGGELSVFFEDGYRIAIRSYSLDAFQIFAKIASRRDLVEVGPERRLRRRIKQMLNMPIEKYVVREKQTFVYDPSLVNIKQDVYLIGSWQSYKYIDSISAQLMFDFRLRDRSEAILAAWSNISKSTCPVSMHIRRGDYANKASGFSILSLDYYKSALEYLRSKLATFDVFVFTDDPEWAKQNLKDLIAPNSMTVVSNPELKDFEELTLMSMCRHQIIANSSFSWWAAWLNDDFEKIVTAPRRWNGVDEHIPTGDLIPPRWTLI